jgi:hypothetical protein
MPLYAFIHSLLNVLVQIADKMGLEVALLWLTLLIDAWKVSSLNQSMETRYHVICSFSSVSPYKCSYSTLQREQNSTHFLNKIVHNNHIAV